MAVEANTQHYITMLEQAPRLEITYFDASGRAVPRGQATTVRRCVVEDQGRILQERIRTVLRDHVS
jgi:hypothetical protein